MAGKENKELQDEQLKQVSGGEYTYWEEHCPLCKSSNYAYRATPAGKEWYECRDCGTKWWPL